MGTDEKIKLQVQIATLGQEGIERVARHTHPHVPGVRWLVCLQVPDGDISIPDELKSRKDFDVVIFKDRGLTKNRNHGLDYLSDSEFILIADDDVDYYEDGIQDLINKFESLPKIGVVFCRYTSNGRFVKNYGDGEFSTDNTPFGWYPTSFEMAFRRDSIKDVRFNENFGIGSGKFIAGEESIFVADFIRKGGKGLGVPIIIGEHVGQTTGERLKTDPEFLKAQGATMTHIKPWTWFPRLLVHAHRTPMPFFKCLRYTMSGACLAYRYRMFRHK